MTVSSDPSSHMTLPAAKGPSKGPTSTTDVPSKALPSSPPASLVPLQDRRMRPLSLSLAKYSFGLPRPLLHARCVFSFLRDRFDQSVKDFEALDNRYLAR